MIETRALACDCKVGRVARRRGLDGVHDALYRRWTGEDGDSLRDLAAWFDCRVLEAALAEAGERPPRTEVRRLYDALPEGDADRPVPAALAGADVAVADLRADFVSHQTIHSHLRECLHASREGGEGALSTVDRLRDRTADAADRTLRSLSEADLALEEFDVDVTVGVTCQACGRTHRFGDLVPDGGCPCRQG